MPYLPTPIVRITFPTTLTSRTHGSLPAAQSLASSPTKHLNISRTRLRTQLRFPNPMHRHLFKQQYRKQAISQHSQTTHPYKHYLAHMQPFVTISGGYLRQLLRPTLHSNSSIMNNKIIGRIGDTEAVDAGAGREVGEEGEILLLGLQNAEKTTRCLCLEL